MAGGFLARILRFSRSGHHSLLASPWVGWVRPVWATGQPPLVGVATESLISPTTASGLSDTAILSESVGMRLQFRHARGGGEAGGAQAPVDHLGLIDHEAVVLGGGQAWHLADGAVHVGDGAAGAAHDVVVIVSHASLITGQRARRLDAPQQAGAGERLQHVIHSLM